MQKNFFHSTFFTLRYVSRSKNNLTLLSRFLMFWLRTTELDLSNLYTGNLPLPANTYTVFLVLRYAKSMLWQNWFTKLDLSAQAPDFRPSSTKFDPSWLVMATQTILLHPHLRRRSDNLTNPFTMNQKMPDLSPPFMVGK